ncbi:Glutathione import ATP-binding protein GsiA [Raoultella terrigena]|uniref:Glutathione import ATP-binding protein GsiA n=1 Tax=Raoultella terrigena TaxID=577 RepID=A0A3P8M0D6_RAOTE|nr:Glutathione import ATP-binding protein GsiA [Raoultella terrigena]
MRQRILIALAAMCRPRLLIADEPTTALDATVQREVLQLLKELCQQQQMALLIITHGFRRGGRVKRPRRSYAARAHR